jgi:hypothetical protein
VKTQQFRLLECINESKTYEKNRKPNFGEQIPSLCILPQGWFVFPQELMPEEKERGKKFKQVYN